MSNDETMTELIKVFRSEVGELFDSLAALIAELPNQTGAELDRASRSAMRLAHNLKGSSGSVGLVALSRLAHAFESALAPLCSLDAAPNPEHAKVLREAVISMQRLAEQPDTDDDSSLADLVERLRAFASTATSVAPQANKKDESSAARQGPMGGPAPIAPGAPVAESAPALELGPSHLRISSDRLDALAGHLDELVKVRGAWARHVKSLVGMAHEQQDAEDPRTRALRQAIAAARTTESVLSRLVDDLTMDVQRIRTVALTTVAPQWRRVVREAAETLGKHIELSVDVGDTAVDKQVIEHLRDPLVHLLRNAVDHGIEPWQERHLLGKSAAAALSITAQMAGTGISIEVRDDGRGLEPTEIAAAAVFKNVLSDAEAQALSAEEKLDLLFCDGFSTAQELTSISGRGVGLAAVRQGVAKAGGRCTVSSGGSGLGTTFRIDVPVSVLSTTGLLTKVGGTVCMLPISDVERALRVNSDELRSLHGAVVLDREGTEQLPLLALGDGQSSRKDEQPQKDVVVVGSAGSRVGLIVDEILEQQECVIRGLPWNIRRVNGVHGVVVLDDGAIAIALDVAYLLKRIGSSSGNVGQTRRRTSASAKARILVVDDSLTQRTLQRNILTSAGYTADVAVDGVDAWERMRQNQYDLLLCDIEMPRMDGLELTRQVRRDPTRSSLPIVLVTSRGKESDIQAGASAGADEYLVKGQFDNESLLLAVERHLYGK